MDEDAGDMVFSVVVTAVVVTSMRLEKEAKKEDTRKDNLIRKVSNKTGSANCICTMEGYSIELCFILCIFKETHK